MFQHMKNYSLQVLSCTAFTLYVGQWPPTSCSLHNIINKRNIYEKFLLKIWNNSISLTGCCITFMNISYISKRYVCTLFFSWQKVCWSHLTFQQHMVSSVSPTKPHSAEIHSNAHFTSTYCLGYLSTLTDFKWQCT